MKPVDFALHRPSSLSEAVELLSRYDEAKVLAGGQSLVPMLNFRLARPDHLVDIGRLAVLGRIVRTESWLSIGALVRHRRCERSAAVAAAAPLLSAAVPYIAHAAIRERGTIGGSIAHADAAAEVPAVVVALDAVLVAVGPRGERRIPAADFFVSNFTTTLASDEILTEIRIPSARPSTHAAFLEVSRRRGDFALVGAGAQLLVADTGIVTDARLCLTGVDVRPVRPRHAESLLEGEHISELPLATIADVVRGSVDPPSDLHAPAAYRRHVAGTLISRAILAASGRSASTIHGGQP